MQTCECLTFEGDLGEFLVQLDVHTHLYQIIMLMELYQQMNMLITSSFLMLSTKALIAFLSVSGALASPLAAQFLAKPVLTSVINRLMKAL